MMGKKKHASGEKKDSPGKKGKHPKASGKAGLPEIVRASGKKVRRIFTDARDAALKKRGDTKRADAVAFDVLGRTHEQVGDRFERREKAKRHAEPASDAAPVSELPPRPEEELAAVDPAIGEEVPAAVDPAPAEEERAGVEPAPPPAEAPAPEAAEPTPEAAPPPGPPPAAEAPASPEPTQPAEATPPATTSVPSRSAGRARQADVQTWTTTNLREAARRLEIAGRSKMTRDQLIKAVQDAEAGGSRAASRR